MKNILCKGRIYNNIKNFKPYDMRPFGLRMAIISNGR